MVPKNQTNPLVSVIIPVYNTEKFLERCINSVLNQSLEKIEVIAVNDKSPDNSLQKLQELSDKDKRLVIIDKKTNEGVHAARADGVKSSTAPYIAFADSDDWYDQSMLKSLYDAAKENDADITLCGARQVDKNETPFGLKVSLPSSNLNNDSVFKAFCQTKLGSGVLWNKLYKREIIKESATANWGWRAPAVEDTLVNIGCFNQAKKVHTIPDILYNYLIHPEAATSNVSNAHRFAKHIRAYATAVEYYRDLSEGRKRLIDELYRTQLQDPVYQLEDSNLLTGQSELLEQSIEIFKKHRPQVLWECLNPRLLTPGTKILYEPAAKKVLWALRELFREIKRKLRTVR